MPEYASVLPQVQLGTHLPLKYSYATPIPKQHECSFGQFQVQLWLQRSTLWVLALAPAPAVSKISQQLDTSSNQWQFMFPCPQIQRSMPSNVTVLWLWVWPPLPSRKESSSGSTSSSFHIPYLLKIQMHWNISTARWLFMLCHTSRTKQNFYLTTQLMEQGHLSKTWESHANSLQWYSRSGLQSQSQGWSWSQLELTILPVVSQSWSQ